MSKSVVRCDMKYCDSTKECLKFLNENIGKSRHITVIYPYAKADDVSKNVLQSLFKNPKTTAFACADTYHKLYVDGAGVFFFSDSEPKSRLSGLPKDSIKIVIGQDQIKKEFLAAV